MKSLSTLLLACACAAPAAAQAPYMHRMDKVSPQQGANGFGAAVSISADGNYVTYLHTGKNLLPSAKVPPNGLLLLRQDTRGGLFSQVNLDGNGGWLEVAAGPTASAPGYLSASGQLVTLTSATPAPHLGDLDGARDVFLRDVKQQTTEWLSQTNFGPVPIPDHVDPCPSGDGRFVVYLTQLEPWAKSKGQFDGLALADRMTGTSMLIDQLDYRFSSLEKLGYQRQPLISLDGSTVAVMVPAADGSNEYVLRAIDVASLAVTDHATVRNRRQDYGTFSIDGTGKRIAFQTAYPLHPKDKDAQLDIYTYELASGSTALCSATPVGVADDTLSQRPGISPDGRYVSFQASGSGFHAVSPTSWHMYVADTDTGLVTLESINDLAVPGDVSGQVKLANTASAFNLSNRGEHVVFHSTFANLAGPHFVPLIGATPVGIFLRERGTAGPQLTAFNLFAGQLATIQVTEAKPNAPLLVGLSVVGKGPFPSYWGLVNLTPPVSVIKLDADANGIATLTEVMPTFMQGTRIWMEGVDLLGNESTTPFTGIVR